MGKVLDNLWYGNIRLDEQEIVKTAEGKKLRKDFFEYEEKIKPMLSEELNQLLDKQNDILMHLNSMAEKELFITGFRFGARLMIEIFENDNFME